MKLKLNRRRLILLLIVLVFVLAAGVLLRDFVRQNIVNPLVDLGWLVYVHLLTVPQVVFWAVFMLLAISVAGRSLSRGPGRSAGQNRVMITAQLTSRYHHWQAGLEALPNSPFARERIERELQGLVLQVLAEQQRTDFETLRARQMRGELDLSGEGPAIVDLFLHDGRAGYPDQPPLLRRLWARLLRRPLPYPPDQPPLDVPGIVSWLEAQTGSVTNFIEEDHSGTETQR